MKIGYRFRMSQHGPQCVVEKINHNTITFVVPGCGMTGRLNTLFCKLYDIRKAK